MASEGTGAGPARMFKVRVTDTREVRADVTDAPLLFTAAGKRPLVPWWITVTWTFGGEHPYVEIGGKLVNEPERLMFLVRRFGSPEWWAGAPEWIRKFAEEHRPEVADA